MEVCQVSVENSQGPHKESRDASGRGYRGPPSALFRNLFEQVGRNSGILRLSDISAVMKTIPNKLRKSRRVQNTLDTRTNGPVLEKLEVLIHWRHHDLQFGCVRFCR